MPAGRPEIYTPELVQQICERIALGNSLRTVCLAEDMPSISTIFKWFTLHPEFKEQYASATEERTDSQHEDLLAMGEEAIALAQSVDAKASSAVVQAVKLKADNLKWSMSKMKPKKFGDKVDLTTNGKDLPVPILPYAVPSNNRDSQDSTTDETAQSITGGNVSE